MQKDSRIQREGGSQKEMRLEHGLEWQMERERNQKQKMVVKAKREEGGGWVMILGKT